MIHRFLLVFAFVIGAGALNPVASGEHGNTTAFIGAPESDPFQNKFLVFGYGADTTIHEDVRLHILGGEAFLILRPAQVSRLGQATPVYHEWLRLSSHAQFYLFDTRADAERFVKPQIDKRAGAADVSKETSIKTFPHPEQLNSPFDADGVILQLGKSMAFDVECKMQSIGGESFLTLRNDEKVGGSNWFPLSTVDRILVFSSSADAKAYAKMLFPRISEANHQTSASEDK